MEHLTIVGTEVDRLVLANEAGDRFTLPIDDVLRAELRKARQVASGPERTARPSPREIQSHIRAGLSAAEVAELLGATLADVERFETPVLAEREHIVNQALSVPVLMGADVEPDGALSFGTAIRGKLADLGATGETWTSWKDEDGWKVKLAFTASEVDHDARWSFDPRRSTLSPQNSDATQLSRQGPLPEGLIPRLRAVDAPHPLKDDSRFDSGAFGPRLLPDPESEQTAQEAAIKRAPEPVGHANPDTADLLEALRRRRGQREPQPEFGDDDDQAPVAPVSLFEPEDEAPEPIVESDEDADQRQQSDPSRSRRGRRSMPSWDDIVFGARTDD